MLQRIQTVYLLLSAFVTGVLPFAIAAILELIADNLWGSNAVVIFGLFAASTLLSVITILFFKNRKLQIVLGRLNILINLITLGVFVYWTLMTSGETSVVSEKDVGKLLPFISIVLLVLANKAIKRDEQLVKSVDRLR